MPPWLQHYSLQIPCVREPPGERSQLEHLTQPPTSIQSAGGRASQVSMNIRTGINSTKDGSHYANALSMRAANKTANDSRQKEYNNKFIHGTH
jgi:hypothetical protein